MSEATTLVNGEERIIGPAHYDYLQAMIGMDMRDPETFRAHYEVAEQEKFLVEQPCSEGNCVELIDSRTGENTGGWGPVGCRCQETEDDTTLRNASSDVRASQSGARYHLRAGRRHLAATCSGEPGCVSIPEAD